MSEMALYGFTVPGSPPLFGDSFTELIIGLVPEYESVAESVDDAYVMRVELLAQYAAVAQSVWLSVVDGAVMSGLPADATQVLFSGKHTSVFEFERWPYLDVPLILFATHYAPYTGVTPPKGEGVVWVNPHTEETFITSLVTLGVGELLVQGGDGF